MAAKKSKKRLSSASYIDLLGKTPSVPKHEVYHWADYVELKCLANPDLEFTKAEFVDVLGERQDLRDDWGVEDENEDEIGNTTVDDSLKLSDKRSLNAFNIFNHLASRAKLFGNDYPFELDKTSSILTRKKTLTEEHNIYLFLLFSASLQYSKKYKGELTSSFECFCYDLMPQLIATSSETIYFGASNMFMGQRKTFEDRCHSLSEKILEKCIIQKGSYPKNNVGDGGLDICAVTTSGDKLNHNIIYFAQCACGVSDWKSKQLEASRDTWSQKFHFSSYPIPMVFIPFSYRTTTGDWFNSSDLNQIVLIDRKRCLFHYKTIGDSKKLKAFNKTSYKKVIDSLLNEKEKV